MTFASPELLLGLLLVPAAIGAVPPGAAPAQPLRGPVHERGPAREHRPQDPGLAAPRAAGPVPRRDHRPRHRARPAVDGHGRPAQRGDDHPHDRRLGLDAGDRRQPTRLAAAQKAASDFVDQLPSAFRVGLVVFSTEARIGLPPTTDHAQVHTAIDNLAGARRHRDGRRDRALARGRRRRRIRPPDRPGPDASQDPSASQAPGASASPDPSASSDPSASPAPKEKPLVATVLLCDGANSTGSLEPRSGGRQRGGRRHAGVHDRPRHGRRHGGAPGPEIRPDAARSTSRPTPRP